MKVIKKLLNLIEKVAIKKNNWRYIPGSEIKYFYIDIRCHKGLSKQLKDGTRIEPGDMIGELHVNNANMPEVNIKNVKWFIAQIKMELELLAIGMTADPINQCKAFYGRTVLYPFVVRFGFEVFPIEGRLFQWFLNFWDFVILKAYSKSKVKIKKRITKEIWISSIALKKIGEGALVK